MYLHCDWHASHRLRVAMDDIFDEKNFRNEIIWHYHTGGVSSHYWGRKHDTIFFYTKSDNWTYNLIKEKRYYDKAFFGATEGYLKEADGRLYIMAHPDDVWEIPAVLNLSKERLGYPTQKPEALLKHIIEASSNKEDIVLDPFCGCGTTLAVAHQFGRKWIGIDVSPIACNKTKERLNKVGASDVLIIGAPKTIDELKALSDWEFQNWVIDRIGGVPSPKKSADMGIDGYTFMAREPVQVKQSEGIGRNVVDNFETAIRREHKASGYIVAFSFAKSAYEEAARAKAEDKMDIKLVRVNELDKCFTTLK